MTTPQHAVHGYIIGAIISPAVGIASALLATLPDALGYYGRRFRKDNWELYLWSHSWERWYFWIIPPLFIHKVIDSFWHNPDYPYGWYEWGVKAEIAGWIISLISIKLFIL